MEFSVYIKPISNDKPAMNNFQTRSLPGQKTRVNYFQIKKQSHLDPGILNTNLSSKRSVTANEYKLNKASVSPIMAHELENMLSKMINLHKEHSLGLTYPLCPYRHGRGMLESHLESQLAMLYSSK